MRRPLPRHEFLPAGYTFNPDGTAIYLTIAAVFVAQATNVPLSLSDQLVILSVLMLTSKGSAGVAGAGFVTLAATLGSLHTIPVAGLVLLLGVDRFLNEARAITNLIGNGLATIAVAKWEGAFDEARWDEVTGRAYRASPSSEPYTCLQTSSRHHVELAKGVGSIHAQKDDNPMPQWGCLSGTPPIWPGRWHPGRCAGAPA